MNKPKIHWNLEIILAAALVVAVSAIAFLPFAHRFGLYFDDWNVVWAGHTNGLLKIREMAAIDRPMAGRYGVLIYALLGENPFPWSIWGYGMRLLGALGLLWMLRMVWPKQSFATFAMALLYFIYPGFLRQPDALQYQTQFTAITAEILSIALTVRAFKESRWLEKLILTGLSMGLALFAYLLLEYLIGLETLRILLIWVTLSPSETQRFLAKVGKSALRYLPYVASLGIFLVWRLFFFKSARSATDVGALSEQYFRSPVYQLVRVFSEWIKDFGEIVVSGWVVPSYRLISAARLREFVISLILAVAAAGLCYLYLALLRRRKADDPADSVEDDRSWSVAAIGIGALSVLGAALPIIVSNRSVEFESTFDRYTLPGSIGAAILVVGLLGFLGRSRLKEWGFLLLVGLAVMTHYHNGVYFSQYWQAQRDFWWQVSWRVPQLKVGTLLLAHLPGGYPFEEDYEVWGPANLIYYPDSPTLRVQAEVLNMGTLQEVMLGARNNRTVRTILVERDFAMPLVLSMPTANSCVRAVDGKNVEIPASEEPTFYLAYPYSLIHQIDLTRAHPPLDETIFGKEPAHTWCFYYEKMALARQQGNWDEVARLADEAAVLGLRPMDRSEWIPALEAYVYQGRAEDVKKLASIIKEAPMNARQICDQSAGPKNTSNSFVKDEQSRMILQDTLCGRP